MKKLYIAMSVLMVAVFSLAAMSWADEASVFDDAEGLVIRAYTTDVGPPDSAYIEVRDDNGDPIPCDVTECLLDVTKDGSAYPVTSNPFEIHDDLTIPDISAAIDDATGIVYVFCTNVGAGLHVMQFDIGTLLPVDGLCGPSDDGAFYSAPTTGLCSAGTVDTPPSGPGPWTWDCLGANGGTDDVGCSAVQMEDGVCGPSDGGTFPSAPTTGLCDAGNPTTVTGSGPWYWDCTGVNGGATDSCSADVESSGDADLTVTYFDSPGVLYNPFLATVKVKNIGTGPAGQFNVKMYISRGYTPSPDDVLLTNGTQTVPGLAAGEEITLIFDNLRHSGLPIHQWYRLFAIADADNEVAETNEDNNWKKRDCKLL